MDFQRIKDACVNFRQFHEYSAKDNNSPSTVDDYISYHVSRHDDWKGKMRERLSELYKVLSHTDRKKPGKPILPADNSLFSFVDCVFEEFDTV